MALPTPGVTTDWGDDLNAYIESGEYPVNTQTVTGAYTVPATHAAHKLTMTGDTTLTFTAPTAGHTFALLLAGAHTPTFPASVDWSGATAPTYGTPSLYVFTTFDSGTTWLGSQVGSAFA